MTTGAARSGRLAGAVAIVTGASRGIGRAVAARLVADGARGLVLGYRERQAEAEAVQQACAEAGAEAVAVGADLGQPGAERVLLAAALERFGRVDVLVNCAAIAQDGLLGELSDEELAVTLAVNVAGLVRMTRAVVRPMLRQRSGAIVSLSSVAARQPGRGNALYAGSKGFVEAFTRALAVEVGRKGIRVNAVAPGVIETEMSRPLLALAGDALRQRIALARTGSPEEVAALVAFLASDEARYVSGAVLAVDGGFLGP